MLKGLKVYIADPITGTDDFKERFEEAEKYLRDQGALPMHSAGLPQGYSWSDYLRICFRMIDVCEAVYFLNNYSESEGARREFAYAARNNKQLLYEGLEPVWKGEKAHE
jgi:hypothetical protein